MDDVCQVEEVKVEEVGRCSLGKKPSQELSGMLVL